MEDFSINSRAEAILDNITELYVYTVTSKNNLQNTDKIINTKLINTWICDKYILINIISDDINIIKNQIISFILGYYKFTDFKTSSTIPP